MIDENDEKQIKRWLALCLATGAVVGFIFGYFS